MNRKQRKQRIREQQLIEEAAVRSAGVPPAVVAASSPPHPGCRQDAGDTAGGTPALQFDRDTQRCSRAMTRMRQHRELCKREGLKLRPAGLRYVYGKIAPSQMVWRRISSMTIPLEPFMDAMERRAGLERLMKWLEKTYLNRRDAEAQSEQGLGSGVEGLEATDNPKSKIENPKLVFDDWNSELGSWQRVKTDGFSVEAICANLGISRWKLTQLTKEYCNLTVNEVIDGIKVRKLKAFLLGRIKEAAFELWGKPGYFAAHKIEGFVSCSEKCPSEGMTIKVGPRKQSRFFKLKPGDLLEEEKWAEKERRTAQLVHKMWEGFDLESWAISAGYSNAARLKRAVLTVMGKTLGKLEDLLAGEVIEFYQCAEERELRNIACREDEIAAVFRAREFYHGSEDRPAEPFLDMWSAYEFAARDWLERMAGAFG